MNSLDEPRHWRYSLPAKVVALGFSLFIVSGNIWLAYAMIGAPAKVWNASLFVAALVIVAAGGLALGARQLAQMFSTNIKVNAFFKRFAKNAR